MEKEKRLEKERKAAQKAREEAEKDAQKRIPPSEMFRNETDKYSQFDDKVIQLIMVNRYKDYIVVVANYENIFCVLKYYSKIQ